MSKDTMSEETMIRVLQQSLYPGASLDSVRMVMAYCVAQRLDPFSKPVHLVPINVKEGNGWVTRDVIMPGINLYRIRAERTNQFLGSSEPEFGPIFVLDYTDKDGKEQTLEYPEWCRVTVKKLVGNRETEWSAREFWIENYQTASRNTYAPNEMWKKRPWGQIGKCAEAQALRKAFPDAVGAEPTFEERGGMDVTDHGFVEPTAQPTGITHQQHETLEPVIQTRSDATLERARKTTTVRDVEKAMDTVAALKERTGLRPASELAREPASPAASATDASTPAPSGSPKAPTPPSAGEAFKSIEAIEIALGELPSLTDLKALDPPALMALADSVGLSFVKDPAQNIESIRLLAEMRGTVLIKNARPIAAALKIAPDLQTLGELRSEWAPIAKEMGALSSYHPKIDARVEDMGKLFQDAMQRLSADASQ